MLNKISYNLINQLIELKINLSKMSYKYTIYICVNILYISSNWIQNIKILDMKTWVQSILEYFVDYICKLGLRK